MDIKYQPNKRKKVISLLGLTRLFSEVAGIPTKENGIFSFVCALAGAVIKSFGGWSASLSVLLWLVIGDYTTGLLASAIDKTGLSSKIGFLGIPKKLTIFFLVFIGHKLDQAMQINIVMNIVIYFYVTNEVISLLENAGRMGLPVPKQLVQIIQALKGKID